MFVADSAGEQGTAEVQAFFFSDAHMYIDHKLQCNSAAIIFYQHCP